MYYAFVLVNLRGKSGLLHFVFIHITVSSLVFIRSTPTFEYKTSPSTSHIIHTSYLTLTHSLIMAPAYIESDIHSDTKYLDVSYYVLQ